MGSMFRSEEMSLCQLFVQPEAIYSTVAELGEIGIAQFKDLNPDTTIYQRKYTAEVRRIDEMERKLELIHRELIKDEIEIPEMEEELRYPSSREIIDLDFLIEKNESEIMELSEHFSQLLENQKSFIEHRCVLDKAELFFSENAPTILSDSEDVNHQLHFVAGVVDVQKLQGFERMLWRISLGNVFLKHKAIEMAFKNGESEVFKTVFIMFFQGDQLKMKVKKVCDGYHADVYPCPNDFDERLNIKKDLQIRKADLETVVNKTKDHRQRVLKNVAKSFNDWSAKLKKLKATYHVMNMFNMDVSEKYLIGECWVPKNQIQMIHNALIDGSKASASIVPALLNVIGTQETPPTYHRTNKFTRGFQNLIDAYGVASYREANPGLYTIVTFPFLFAIMYGDMGHGLILTIAAFWMILSEKRVAKMKAGEIFNLFFSGRYIILLMGLFSIYTGFVYNDVFSKSMNIFGSSWKINYNVSTVMMMKPNSKLNLNPSTDDLMSNRVYPIGLDPVWAVAPANKILFLNSFKMKLSIIFGVFHMLFGISVSVVNFNHFRRRASIFLEFLPQIIFLLLLFGYLVFMVFFKWVQFGPKYEQRYSPGCAPSVLVYFINMMLLTKEKALDGCEAYMYSGQKTVQTTFVIMAVFCIPWMLLGKPLYTMFTRKFRKNTVTSNREMESTSDFAQGHEEESMSEIWTHQAIHTIEYVLGTVSHTASYLRLWALSLAHAQLSEILWTKLLAIGFMNIPYPYVGSAILVYTFFLWSCLTLGILVVIEGLSAFLHTLRLHWVEFMSKFYEGDGKMFEPFSFQTILNGED